MAGNDPQRLLPTLRSRVQRVRLPMPEASQALDWLETLGVTQPGRALAVAGGSPLAASALHEAGLDDSALKDLPRALSRGHAQLLLGKPLPLVIDLLQRVAHDAMACAAGGQPVFFAPSDMPAAGSLPALVAWQRELLRVARHAEHPWHAPLLLEALVTNGARCWPAAAASARQGRGRSLHSAG